MGDSLRGSSVKIDEEQLAACLTDQIRTKDERIAALEPMVSQASAKIADLRRQLDETAVRSIHEQDNMGKEIRTRDDRIAALELALQEEKDDRKRRRTS